MRLRYTVELIDGERTRLQELTGGGDAWVRRVRRARILLASEQGHCNAVIADTVGGGASTVYRTRRRFVECGLEGALSEDPRPGARRKLTGREETLLVAVACSDPPAGRARWTLELLADEIVQRTGHDGLSRETVRRRLAEQSVKPWQRKMWCIPRVDTEYMARMEDVLDRYTDTLELPRSGGRSMITECHPSSLQVIEISEQLSNAEHGAGIGTPGGQGGTAAEGPAYAARIAGTADAGERRVCAERRMRRRLSRPAVARADGGHRVFNAVREDPWLRKSPRFLLPRKGEGSTGEL